MICEMIKFTKNKQQELATKNKTTPAQKPNKQHDENRKKKQENKSLGRSKTEAPKYTYQQKLVNHAIYQC
jgi:hypothetical protein